MWHGCGGHCLFAALARALFLAAADTGGRSFEPSLQRLARGIDRTRAGAGPDAGQTIQQRFVRFDVERFDARIRRGGSATHCGIDCGAGVLLGRVCVCVVQLAVAAQEGAVATGALPGDAGVWLGLSHGPVQLLHLARPVFRSAGAGAAKEAVGDGGRGGAVRDRVRSARAAGGMGVERVCLRAGRAGLGAAAPRSSGDRRAGRASAGGIPFGRVLSDAPGPRPVHGYDRGGSVLDLRKILHRRCCGGSGSVGAGHSARAERAAPRAPCWTSAFSYAR